MHTFCRACLLLFLPICLLLPGMALAQNGTPRVFLVPFRSLGAGGSDLVTSKLTEQLKGELEGRPGSVTLLTEAMAPTSDAAQGIGGHVAGPDAVLGPARRHYKIGMGLLQVERFDDAIVELKEALALFEGNLAHLKIGSIDELLQTQVHLSAAQLRAGYEDEAEETIGGIIRTNPEFNPAGRGLPPVYQKIVARYKRKLDKEGTGTLELISNPSAAKVYVDGKEQGETPLVLKKISAGNHYVQLARPFAGVWAGKVQFPGQGKKDKQVIDLPEIAAEATVKENREQADAAARSCLEQVTGVLRTGLADIQLKQRGYMLGLRTGADYVIMGYVNTLPSGYRLRPMILKTEGLAFADLGARIQLDFELLGSTMQMKELGDRVVASLSSFPDTMIPDQAPPTMVEAAQLVAASAEAAPEVIAGGIQADNLAAAPFPRPIPASGPQEQAPLAPAETPDLPLEALLTGAAEQAVAKAAPPVVIPVTPTVSRAVPQPPPVLAPLRPSLPPAGPGPNTQPSPLTAPTVVQPAWPAQAQPPTTPSTAPSTPPSTPIVTPVRPLVPQATPTTPWPAMAVQPGQTSPPSPGVAAVPQPPTTTWPTVLTPPGSGGPAVAMVQPAAPAGPPVFPPPLAPVVPQASIVTKLTPVKPAAPAAPAAPTPITQAPAVRPEPSRPVVPSPPTVSPSLLPQPGGSAGPASPAPTTPTYDPGYPQNLAWMAAAAPAGPRLAATAPIPPAPRENAVLAPLPGRPPHSAEQAPAQADDEARAGWYRSWWAVGTAALVVGGGVTAAVLLLGDAGDPRPAKTVLPEVSIR